MASFWNWLGRWLGRTPPPESDHTVEAKAATLDARELSVRIAQGAVDSIEFGYRQHLETPRGDEETAWFLLGRRTAGCLEILAAVHAGEYREASAVHIRLEADFHALAWRVLKDIDPTLDVLGIFHTHPGSLRQPSGGDFQGDSEWVRKLKNQAGVFGIGTSDGGPQVAQSHQIPLGNLCLSWYLLKAGDRHYVPCPVEVFPGENLASRLTPIQAILDAYHRPLLGLARQMARVRFEITVLEGTPGLIVFLPIRASSGFVQIVFSGSAIGYFFGNGTQWFAVDPGETNPEIAVYRLLAESLLFLERKPL